MSYASWSRANFNRPPLTARAWAWLRWKVYAARLKVRARLAPIFQPLIDWYELR